MYYPYNFAGTLNRARYTQMCDIVLVTVLVTDIHCRRYTSRKTKKIGTKKKKKCRYTRVSNEYDDENDCSVKSKILDANRARNVYRVRVSRMYRTIFSVIFFFPLHIYHLNAYFRTTKKIIITIIIIIMMFFFFFCVMPDLANDSRRDECIHFFHHV